MDKTVFTLLQKLKINTIPKEELSFQIQSHPSYPSMHAITGVLTHFNIENIAIQVPVNEETLTQLPQHFIAQVKTDTGEDFVVASNDGLYYDIQYDTRKRKRLSLDEFLTKFTGIMVAVEKDESTEIVKPKSKTILNSFFVLFAVSFIALWFLSNPGLSKSLFFIASLIGIYVSYAIFKQEQGEKTSLGEAFCSGESVKTDCDSVISSKGAQLFGLFKLSDLSLIYFVGMALLSYFITVANLSQTIPFLIGLFAVLITAYSLYYQAFVVKAWCGLCLSIVGVLWFQAVIVLLNLKTLTAFSFSVNEVVLAVLSFSIVSIFWFYLRPQLESLKDLTEEKIKYFKFKRNYNLFNTLLQKNDGIDTQLSQVSEITFGKIENTLPIVIVTNPFCGHCRAVHTLVEAIYKKYKDLVNITIRFNINVSDKESDVVKITSRIIELFYTEGEESAMKALHSIYSGQEIATWYKEWGKCNNPTEYIPVLEKQSEWCKSNQINFTPEILVDGHAFPKEYDRSDLVYFIEDLHENFLENIASQTPVYQTI